jgi:hypothetical protein
MRVPSLAIISSVLALAGGCADIVYLGENGFYAFAMTEDTPPFAETDDAAIYIVEERIEFPIRPPTGEELAELTAGAASDPLLMTFGRAPWVSRDDYGVEIDYILINLDDAPHRVTIVANPISEFHEYSPGVVIDDDEIFAEFAGYERLVEMEPFERITGTIRQEEIDEMAADLASVVQPGVTNPNTFMHPDSQSDHDPRVSAFLPSIVPGLVGVKMGMRIEETSNVVCELTIRVRDDERRIVDVEDAWQLPAPIVFEPSSVTGGVLP